MSRILQAAASAALSSALALPAQYKSVSYDRLSGDVSTLEYGWGWVIDSSMTVLSGTANSFEFAGRSLNLCNQYIVARAPAGAPPEYDLYLRALGETLSVDSTGSSWTPGRSVASHATEIGSVRIAVGAATVDVSLTAAPEATFDGAMISSAGSFASVSGSGMTKSGGISVDIAVVALGSYEWVTATRTFDDFRLGSITVDTALAVSPAGAVGEIRTTRSLSAMHLNAQVYAGVRTGTGSHDYVVSTWVSNLVAPFASWTSETDRKIW